MTGVEIHELELAELDRDQLTRFELDASVVQPGYALDVEGWAEGRAEPVVAIELTSDGLTVKRIALNRLPEDASPDDPVTGFYSQVNALSFPVEFELGIAAVFESGEKVRVGTLRGSRPVLQDVPETKLEPVLVTTLGRSGATSLVRAIATHPKVVAYAIDEPRARVTNYWADVFQSLADPASYMRQLFPNDLRRGWWLGDAEAPARLAEDPTTKVWLAGDAVEELAQLCRKRALSFYEELVQRTGAEDARFFVEKVEPTAAERVAELFPAAPEIILVRNFRDTLASMLSYRGERRLWFPGPKSTWAEHVETLGERARQLYERWTGRGTRSHLLRYEELVSDPEQSIAGLVEYLGLEATVAERDAIVGALATGTQEGRAHQDLPPALAEVAERAFAPALQGFGYE